MSLWRRVSGTSMLVAVAVLIPLGVVARWAEGTVFHSGVFSKRAVALLDSQTVRHQLAEELTAQLARSGNRQAVVFRPAMQLAVEAVIDTDTFRSIFRSAVRQAHQAVLQGNPGGGLDLSDSLAVISATAQLAPAARGATPAAPEPGGGLGSTLESTVERLADLRVWRLRDRLDQVALVGLAGAALAAVAAVAVAGDRRRALRQVGWAVVVGGVVVAVVPFVGSRLVERAIADERLARALGGTVSRATTDLRAQGLWLAGYGLVLIAAAGRRGERLTPAVVRDRASRAVGRLRGSGWGTAVLGVAAIAAGLAVLSDPWATAWLVVLAGGLYLVYLGLTELLGLARLAAAALPAPASPGRRRLHGAEAVAVGFAAVVLGAVVTSGLVISGNRAAAAAEAAGEPICNGDRSLCELRLDEVVLPGSHNAMSSALYPGWLFAEHVETIEGQLHAGVRALLIDTHYGIPSATRMPGSRSPLILTDLAAALQGASAEQVPPEVAERAAHIAARAPAAAGAQRDIFLCHNYCELGAVRFSEVLGQLRTFLETNPNEVVVLIIQDATTPADTAAAFEAAGLASRAATLTPGAPLPTIGELVEAGTNLVVFAETGGPGAPPWYHPAYEGWFQETRYGFGSVDEFTCDPNRGSPDAPLFLVNHWVSSSPPDPAKASAANRAEVLEQRLLDCLAERGLVPNVVAVDFATRGDVVRVAAELNEARLDEAAGRPPAARPPPSTPPPTQPTTTLPHLPDLPDLPPSRLVQSLTGGNPTAFCAALPTAIDAVAAWAYATVTAPPEEHGVADLVMAPTLQRELQALVAPAPLELQAELRPILDRATAAGEALRSAGLDDGALAQLDQEVSAALRDPAGADGLAVVLTAGQALGQRMGQAALQAAGAAFAAAHGDAAPLVELGVVPDAVAEQAGFPCLLTSTG